MWLPKSLKIVGRRVRVLFPHVFKEDPKLMGLSTLSRIFVSDIDDNGEVLPDSIVWITFFHELFHQIDRASGHKVFERDEHEGAIDAFSEIFYQVLADNSKLREAIYKEIK